MYSVTDVSSRTDERLYSDRTIQPLGAMVHNSDGMGAVAYMQGGVLRDGRIASCDYVIVSGGAIYRIVPRNSYSYHAGDCTIRGELKPAAWVNQRYLGIELETPAGARVYYSEHQYKALASLLLFEAAWHNWSPLSVIGHGTSAYPMGRRNDPRNFDWGHLFWLMSHRPAGVGLIQERRAA